MIRAVFNDEHGQPIKHQGLLFGKEVRRPETNHQPQERTLVVTAAGNFERRMGLSNLKQQVCALHQKLLMPRVGEAKPTIVLRPRIKLCRASQ